MGKTFDWLTSLSYHIPANNAFDFSPISANLQHVPRFTIIYLSDCSVLYSEGLAPKNPMLPSGGTLDNVTKTIGRLLDGYDIRLRPNFGGGLCYN